MFTHVVAPLDGSESAERALEYAVDIARKFGARLTLLRAFDGPWRATETLAMSSTGVVNGGIIDASTVDAVVEAAKKQEAEARAYLSALAQRLADSGLDVDALVSEAAPADAILQEAHRQADTVVVMATHGRGGLSKVVFGSVAQAVLAASHAPVLVVRVTPAATTNIAGHDMSGDVTIGADVIGRAGARLGTVSRVIVDANARAVTGVVVKGTGLFAHEAVVPRTRVNRVDGGVVYVEVDANEFGDLDRFTDERYRLPAADDAGLPGLDRGQYVLDVVAAEGAMGAMTPVPPLVSPRPAAAPAPDAGPTALREGMSIFDAQGEKVGEIGELSVAPDSGEPTRITVRRGVLFKHETDLPLDWIADITDHGVGLNVPKERVAALEEGQ